MKIYILSRAPNLYSTHRLWLSVSSRGHEVKIVDYTRCHLLLRDGQPIVLYEGFPLELPDAIIPRIGATYTQEGVALIRHFENMGVATTLSSQALVEARDKLHCLQSLARQGIQIPATVAVYAPEHLALALEVVGGVPVIIKLVEGTHGAGVVLAHTEQTAISVVEAFARTRQKILLQEYIAEAKGTDIRAFVIDGVVVAAMERVAAAGEFRANLHRGATARSIQLSFAELQLAKRATTHLKLGVAGVDILRSERGPLLLEVNASPGLEGIEGATGVAIGRKIVSYVERMVRQEPGSSSGQTFATKE